MSGELKTAAFGDKRNPRQLLIDALEKIENAEVAVLVWRDAELERRRDDGADRAYGDCEAPDDRGVTR